MKILLMLRTVSPIQVHINLRPYVPPALHHFLIQHNFHAVVYANSPLNVNLSC